MKRLSKLDNLCDVSQAAERDLESERVVTANLGRELYRTKQFLLTETEQLAGAATLLQCEVHGVICCVFYSFLLIKYCA